MRKFNALMGLIIPTMLMIAGIWSTLLLLSNHPDTFVQILIGVVSVTVGVMVRAWDIGTILSQS